MILSISLSARFSKRNPYEQGFFSQEKTLLAPENFAKGREKYPIPANMSTTVSPVQSKSFIRLRSTRLPDANMTSVGSKRYLIPFSSLTDSPEAP